MPPPPPRSRVRLPAAERRQQVLTAATALISERGYWGLSLQDVADACGITMPGLLHHFGSKDNLLIAVLEHRDRLDVDALADRLGLGGDLFELLECGEPGVGLVPFVDAIVDRNATQREIVRLYSVLQAESLVPDHPAHAFFTARQETVLRIFARLAPAAAGEPGDVARHVLALLDGLQLQWLRDPGVDLVGAWRTASGAVAGLRPTARTHRPPRPDGG